jgi:hypothetical protein
MIDSDGGALFDSMNAKFPIRLYEATDDHSSGATGLRSGPVPHLISPRKSRYRKSARDLSFFWPPEATQTHSRSEERLGPRKPFFREMI